MLVDAVGSSNSYATTNRPDAYKALRGEILNVNADHSVKAVNSKYFKELISTASQTQRKRKMTDLTKDSPNNTMQVLLNTWIEGSYSPVHRHDEYSEAFVILEGALAFFTFNDNGDVKCNVITSEGTEIDKAIIIEAKQWHAMTAAPKEMGYPGHAIVFEISGHKFEANKPTKALASFAPSKNNGLDGDEEYFNKILKTCK